ncbi:MAG: DUF4912 domain-containing protein [Spirochaetes bacterium]|nr:DUF4912 domain-containing protein [Spirochaetota bacterium]
MKNRQSAKENGRLTKCQLEGLSAGELIKLADSYGIDIPASLERVFIIGELLEADLDTAEESGLSADSAGKPPSFGNDIKVRHGSAESVAIPKQYNISYIEVIIRDPLWAFVFWEIKEEHKQAYENAPGFEGYCLRVVPLNSGGAPENALPSGEESFTIAIGLNDTARYLGFPQDKSGMEPAAQDAGGRGFTVKLCAMQNGHEATLASSMPFVMSGGAGKDSGGLGNRGLQSNLGLQNNLGLHSNPCISLSGLQDFSIAQGSYRQLRAKRH